MKPPMCKLGCWPTTLWLFEGILKLFSKSKWRSEPLESYRSGSRASQYKSNRLTLWYFPASYKHCNKVNLSKNINSFQRGIMSIYLKHNSPSTCDDKNLSYFLPGGVQARICKTKTIWCGKPMGQEFSTIDFHDHQKVTIMNSKFSWWLYRKGPALNEMKKMNETHTRK